MSDDNKERFFYLRNFAKQPIGVMALRKEDGVRVRVAASLCAPQDRWNRDLGVLRAKARLNSKKHSLVLGLGSKEREFLIDEMTASAPQTALSIDGILDHLMPPIPLRAPPWKKRQVDVQNMGIVLQQQIQRLLGVKK